MIRTCNICGTKSDVSEFYAGVTSRCKECHKRKVRENRAENVEYYRDYDSWRYQEDPRVKDRIDRYLSTEAGIEKANNSKLRWARNNADKKAAHTILGNAVRDGRIEKSIKCEKCGCSGVRIEGHHEDYSKPLSVTWLCCKCHRSLHSKPRSDFTPKNKRNN